MNPFVTRSRAEELAARLDVAPATGAAPGSAPALAQSLRDVGGALAPALAPRPEFRAALRTRLVAVASVQAVTAASASAPPARTAPAPAWLAGRRARQGAGVAAGALASVVAVSGVAVASSASLPGDPFYGVKRTTEALQLTAADSDMEQGGRHLEFAATRLREIRGLTLGRSAVDDDAATTASTAAAPSAPVAERVRRTLADMDAETREGSRLMTDAFRSSQAPAPLLALARFTDRQTARLEGLMPVLPMQAQDRARASLAVLAGVSQETGQLLGVCAPACDPMPMPGTVAPTPEPSPSPSPRPAPTAATRAPEGNPSPAVPRGAEPEPSRAAEPTAARPSARPSSPPRPPSRDVLEPQDRSTLPLPKPSPSVLPVPDVPDATTPLEELLPPGELGLTLPPGVPRVP